MHVLEPQLQCLARTTAGPACVNSPSTCLDVRKSGKHAHWPLTRRGPGGGMWMHVLEPQLQCLARTTPGLALRLPKAPGSLTHVTRQTRTRTVLGNFCPVHVDACAPEPQLQCLARTTPGLALPPAPGPDDAANQATRHPNVLRRGFSAADVDACTRTAAAMSG